VTSISSTVHWVNLQTDPSFEQEQDQYETTCKKMLRNIKGIIFDFDGTLYDNVNFAFYLISANPFDVFRIHRERLVRSRFAGRDFLSQENYNRAFFWEMGKRSIKSPEKLKVWYFNKYMPRMIRVIKNHYKPRPGIPELLKQMESSTCSVKGAVYSDYPVLEERMKALGLSISQKVPLYGPESFGAQKPAVRPFLQIAKNMGLKPEEVLVIGDREETDGLGAFNAGMHFFCLETGNKRYFRLDPNRRRPYGEPQGPTMLMYAGKWEGLINLLLNGRNL